jgi:3-hydroxyacyl-[acyl-carrier-protein] dehydratase
VDKNNQLIVAELDVRRKHCRGHFFRNPLLPASFVTEAAGQAALVLLHELHGRFGLPVRASELKWSEKVRPGDCLRLEMKFEKLGRGVVAYFSGEVFVGKKKVAEISELVFFLEEKSEREGER